MRKVLDLHSLSPKYRKRPKRVGRGTSSGHGKTCGRGTKGQKSRSGGTKGKRFEGGQTPLYRRLPKKRGFKNYPFRIIYEIVNIGDLEKFKDQADFSNAGMTKILGKGTLSKALVVKAHAFSKSAKEAIEKAGGQAVKC